MAVRAAAAAALLLSSVLAIVDNPLPVITALGNTDNWCLFVIRDLLDKSDQVTLPAAACAKVASLRCASWWGPPKPEAPLIGVCQDLYLAALKSDRVHFPSGFSFLTKRLGSKAPGFAAAKKWLLDTGATMTRDAVVAMLTPFGGDIARLYEIIGELSTEFANARGDATARTALTAPENAQWVVKMYKRLQVAQEDEQLMSQIPLYLSPPHHRWPLSLMSAKSLRAASSSTARARTTPTSRCRCCAVLAS